MRTSTGFAALAAVGLARGLSLRGGSDLDSSHQAVMFGSKLGVPGESPLEFCEHPGDDWLITVEQVDLIPNPPAAGQELVIKASGTVKQTIEEGAYVQLQVMYKYIRLINARMDLCEQVKNVDIECPIEAGKLSIVKSVELPNEIPPGKYTVTADVFTEKGGHITCLTAAVTFGNKGALGGLLDL